ncbi:MAG: ABC transporter permease [Chloroflexi bacterium]|nr:ABC transporter permease [Chloroflexota bacterium]
MSTAQPTNPQPIASARTPGWQVLLQQRELVVALVVLALAILLTLSSDHFLTKANILAIILGLSFNAIVAVGMTVLLASGGFDLSVGSTLAFAGAVAGYAMVFWDVPWPVGAFLGLVAGAIVGLGNGLLVSKVRVNPLIATLGMMSVVRGLVLLLTSGFGIPNLPDAFNQLAQGKLFGIQYPVYIMIVVVIVGDILLRRSRYFRQSYFVGGNEKSARLSGIRVGRVQIVNYIIAAVMASLAGLLLTARFGAASVSAGVGVELQVISAVVIGGASLAGGEGTVLGALLGVTLMALISNGLNLLGINVYWQTIIIGAVLIIAVAADSLSRRDQS